MHYQRYKATILSMCVVSVTVINESNAFMDIQVNTNHGWLGENYYYGLDYCVPEHSSDTVSTLLSL